MRRLRLLYVVTHPITARNLMRGQFSFMRNEGLEVFLISSPAEELKIVEEFERITTFPLPMEREIHLWKDVVSLCRLYRKIKKLKPDILNAGTPKAGFLGMVAAWMARVPVRIYTLRGLRLETKSGIAHSVLSLAERITSTLAHRVICVSQSLRAKYVQLGLVKESKTTVLCEGSSNGVDTNRFRDQETHSKQETRETLKIPAKDPVLGFVGRLTHDKGVGELMETFDLLLKSFPNLHLIILGDYEGADAVEAIYARKLQEHPQIIRLGFVQDPVRYYQVMDVLVFPSHREGFPNAPLEAASWAIPTVGFRVTGTVDAVQDGVTGRLVPYGDVRAMADAVAAYLENESLRKDHGRAARDRVLRMFQPEQIWRALHEEYIHLLQQKEKFPSDYSEYVRVVR